MNKEAVALSNLELGSMAEIINITAPGTVGQRLLDMGLVIGGKITVTKIAPLGDPIEIAVKNYKLSLRKSEAQYIMVDKLNN